MFIYLRAAEYPGSRSLTGESNMSMMLEDHETTGLTIIDSPGSGLVAPVAAIDDIVANWESFQTLKARLLKPDDYHTDRGRTYIKKSGWRKIAAAFGISVETIDRRRIEKVDGSFTIEITVKAIAPSGRATTGEAAASSTEPACKGVKSDNNTLATAFTRAANRAISDLVGGGEVSAEEAIDDQPVAAPSIATLPDDYLRGLLDYATDDAVAPAARHILADLLISRVGKYLTIEQSKELAKALKGYIKMVADQQKEIDTLQAELSYYAGTEQAETTKQVETIARAAEDYQPTPAVAAPKIIDFPTGQTELFTDVKPVAPRATSPTKTPTKQQKAVLNSLKDRFDLDGLSWQLFSIGYVDISEDQAGRLISHIRDIVGKGGSH